VWGICLFGSQDIWISPAHSSTGDIEIRTQPSPSTILKRIYAKSPKCKSVEPTDIARHSKTHYDVNRSLFEYYTLNITRVFSLGWSRKYDGDDGEGWEISGFGCKSPLHRAGFRRGDAIQSINGKPTYNVVQLCAAYYALKNNDAFTVTLLRDGNIHRMSYTIIDIEPPVHNAGNE
jgi:S1-C subfamily serine protease